MIEKTAIELTNSNRAFQNGTALLIGIG